jgi:iron-regulated transporter 1
MRRIDLFCKLIGPLVISLIDGFSTILAVSITGGITAISVVIEYWSIARVYNHVPALQTRKSVVQEETQTTSRPSLRRSIRQALAGVMLYVNHSVFLPSLSLALLYMTVLSFSGQMITYLLTLGLSSGIIGALRGISAIAEISATWLAPKVTDHIGNERAGIWFLNWQIICVMVACVFFWIDASPTIAAIGTITAVIASRVGLWGFDLSAQTIVQEVSLPTSTMWPLSHPLCGLCLKSTERMFSGSQDRQPRSIFFARIRPAKHL